MEPVSIYKWVNDNNPPDDAQYGKGWWDYIDFLYRLDELYGPNKTTVVSTYHLTTPPPSEVLFMPVARLETERAAFVMRERLDLIIGPKWTVSVIRQDAARLPLYGLIDEQAELTAAEADGFEPSWVYPSYASSPGRFTARVQDKWELFTFVWVIAHS